MGIVLKKLLYKKELTKSMNYLAKNRNVVFIGQSINYPGHAIYSTLEKIENKKKIELPVFEETQMGISIGMAMLGYIPVSIYPRFDFMLLAYNQLINHLDKIRSMSDNEFTPKVIIRVAIGSKHPLNSGPQHSQNYTLSLKKMLHEVNVVFLNKPEKIFFEFKKALIRKDNKSSILVEHGDYYIKK